MQELKAAELRRSLGRVARELAATGEPILLTLGKRPVGVIISMRDFEERFALHDAAARRRALVAEILDDAVESDVDVDTVLSDLRG
jgi:hypothetical protein